MQRTTTAPALKTGETIGIAAPASCLDAKLLQSGAERLASWGYPVLLDPRLIERHGSFAGSDEVRAELFVKLLRNPEVKAIWCARGGYGVTRLLSQLDTLGAPALLRKKPKVILGYSDITALHLYAFHHAKLKTVHSPVVATKKWLELPKKSQKILQSILAGTMGTGKQSHTLAWPTKLLHPLHGGAMEGRILGGNLTLLSSMAGTPWMPSLKGNFLFFEDCAEPAYKLDRMLTQLHNSGALRGIAGAFVGDLSADVALGKGEKHAWKAVLEDRLASFGVPVLYNLPVGHGRKNEALPLGTLVRLTKAGKIELLEQVLGH